MAALVVGAVGHAIAADPTVPTVALAGTVPPALLVPTLKSIL